jgi:hypothetical protein
VLGLDAVLASSLCFTSSSSEATIVLNRDDDDYDIMMTITANIHPHSSSTYGRDVSFVNIVIVLHDSFSSGGQALDHDQQRPSITGTMMMMMMMMIGNGVDDVDDMKAMMTDEL